METITHPITGQSIQVALADFPEDMKWAEAKKACLDLGDGWRLPTKVELNIMYEQLHKKGLGGFTDHWYWSSTEVDHIEAWGQFFSDGGTFECTKDYDSQYVRAVRTL